VHTDSL